MARLHVGLTGGIGSGKSAAAERFAALGVPVVDADQLSRELVAPGQPALAQLVEHFGRDCLNAQGELDRAALRRRIFADPDERRWLEALLHPLIEAAAARRLARADGPYALLVSPLLLEAGQDALVDRVLVVDVDEATQIERAGERDGNEPAQIRAIIDAQMPREKRLARADDVLDNSGTPAALDEQVTALHQHYLALSARGR